MSSVLCMPISFSVVKRPNEVTSLGAAMMVLFQTTAGWSPLRGFVAIKRRPPVIALACRVTLLLWSPSTWPIIISANRHIAVRMTPAQAAGVESGQWTIAELVERCGE